ncbi:MAG: gamma-glutamyl-gamma-aminobutyrate hydrolase family protein [Terracidiphilus sp.]
MTARIAIPEPSSDPEYNGRSLRHYLDALQALGAEPVVVPMGARQEQAAKLLGDTQGVVLPGSRYDVDPQRYGEERTPQCGEDDPARTAVDELLLQDAFNLHKPILAICHGMQTLNVWCNGSLVQDLDVALKTPVNHRPGRDVVQAHPVRVAPGSRLAALLPLEEQAGVQVNSSHHQAVRVPGDNLLVSAVSPADGVIEALELDAPGHFVIAVQWHPERTLAQSAFSRAIFAALVEAAGAWQPRRVSESVAPA